VRDPWLALTGEAALPPATGPVEHERKWLLLLLLVLVLVLVMVLLAFQL